MGESSACLVRSLSQPSPTSHESKEVGDPIRRALTSSISFGRFMSEPLAWEKWSAFSHDHYLEDAKKYSRPGSVAEKKAYFEAHFKRIVATKAAGSVDQQNTSVNNISESNATDEIDKEHAFEKQQEDSIVATVEYPREKRVTAAVATTRNDSLEKREAAGGSQEPFYLEKHVESSIHFKDIQGTSVNKDVSRLVEDAISSGVSATPAKKTPLSFRSKSRVHTDVSTVKPSVKREIPIRTKINGQAMAYNTKTTKVSVDKNPKSLQTSIDFSSHETKKPLSPLLQRIMNSKFVTNLTKTPKESTTPHTHTRVSVNASAKNLPAGPQPENGRTKSLLHKSVAEMVKERKPKTSPMPSQSSTTHGTKECCPIVSPPFSLKTEERAAKRKEFFQKIEDKRKAQEAENEKLQRKPKGNTRNVFEDRQLPISQAKTNTSIDLGINASKVPAKKNSTSQPCSPMVFKKQSTESCHNSRPPWRHALKIDSTKDGLQKNYLPPSHSNKLLPKKSTRENAPPNVQH